MDLTKGLPIDNWTKFAATQAGRDKVYRFFQYVARYVATRSTGDKQQKYQKLSAALGLARRLFRAGKPIEDINSMLKSLTIQDPVMRTLTCSRHLLLACWLSVDTVQWLQTVGFIQIADPKVLDKKAGQFWLTMLIISNLINLYKFRLNTLKIAAKRIAISKDSSNSELKNDFNKLQVEKSTLYLDLFRDTLDMVLPAAMLEIITIDSAYVGIAGAITSFIQGYQLWPKS
jgi:hypothetical protein